MHCGCSIDVSFSIRITVSMFHANFFAGDVVTDPDDIALLEKYGAPVDRIEPETFPSKGESVGLIVSE
jgi:hypothetical protein